MPLRLSGNPLFLGAQGDDVARVHRALRALGRSVPAVERAGRVFGPGTLSLLKALQEELGLPPTGAINAATVRAIDQRLADALTAARIVRGSVRDADGRPFGRGFVLISSQDASGEQVIGKSPLDATDGSYQISYIPPAGSQGRVDLRIEVQDASGVLETTPSSASILTDAGPLEVVNFVLSGSAHPPGSEFDLLVEGLKPFLGNRGLADLTEDGKRHEVSLLASQSGFSPDLVAKLVLAHRLARDTGTPAAVFYGLLRQGLPATEFALHSAAPAVRARALKQAVDRGAAPAEVGGKKIADLLADFAPVAGDQLQGLLGGILNPNERRAFVDQYLKSSQDPAAFWRQVGANPALANRAARLKLTVQLGILTNNHVPLVDAVRALPNIRQASDVARLTEGRWRTLIQAQGVGTPADTPGATPAEKTNNYVQQILAQVEAAFPTRFFAERLGTSAVATFLKAQPSYDLKTTYPEQFFQRNPAAAQSLAPQDREQLQSLQRLYRLTGNTQETIALAAKGFHSAQQISRFDRKVFSDQHKDILSVGRADAIHAQALRTHALALALFAEHAAGLNRTGLQALPKVDPEKQALLATASGAIPDWRTLFGAFDLCDCQECASAHGPAAYLVDVLRFLEERGVRAALFARRPDLGQIELSCENTNTPLPHIDLVNEILEDVVTPPAPFAPLTLAPALEADLAQTVATAELAAAFSPPLQPDARVETLEAGMRWRIWDEPYAYSIARDNGDLRVVARSRQTAGSAAERRAAPQYRNRAAYAELGRSVFPWNLPFDLPNEEATVFLTHLGVSRRDLIEALRPVLEPFDPNSPVVVQMAAERLGLTDMERGIIVGEPLTPPRGPEEFWGSASLSSLVTVQDLLDRSGLGFVELETLLATWFIDPADALAISAHPDAPIDTCATASLRINGLAADVLTRMHRFVRLWRTLGWTIPELDRALRALAPDPNTPVLTDEVLVRLDHLRMLASRLRLPVAQTLELWPRLANAAPAALEHATLGRQLGLTVQDLLTAIDLIGLDPFRLDRSEDALRFVEVVKAIQISGFGIPQLDYLLRHRFSPAAPFVPRDSTLAQALTEVRAELHKIEAPSNAEMQVLRRSAVIDRIAATLDLPVDVTASLLGRITHGSETALQQFVALSALASELPLSRQNAGPQFETLEKLLKIAAIMQTLRLPASQLDWLLRELPWLTVAPDPPANSIPLTDWFTLIRLQQLRKDLALEDAGLDAILSAGSAVVVAQDRPARLAARQAYLAALRQWLGWPQQDLETLLGGPDDVDDLGLLRARIPDDYRGVDLVIRLARAIGLVKRLGVTAGEASAWCGATVSDADARAIRRAASAKHDAAAWQTLVSPLQDALRDQQRAALVSYLVARPALWTTLGQVDANDLLATFLIDVEMSSCQTTSRIKQAIGSAQLFAQRGLMGLEPGVRTDDPKWAQWRWMKNFRVWEANRKIWLYPENWIEPELRENKTPFFKDLEDELLQSDLDDAAAEQALQHYLEKLDEVARLEIVGVYEDDETRDLHVFGRTFHTPRTTYYRCRKGSTNAWMPWEKVELDIEGDHLIPVIWNGTLMLIWPVFAEKADEKEVEMPGPGEKLKAADRYWEIQLAWSEHRNGRWTGKNLSEAVTFRTYQGEDHVLFGPRVPAERFAKTAFLMRPANGNLPGGGTDGGVIGDDPGDSPPPSTSPSPAPRRLVSKELFSFKALVSSESLVVRGFLRRDYRDAAPETQTGDDQIACFFGEFRFAGCRKIITTAPRSSSRAFNFPLAPSGTKFDRMWFAETASAGLTLFDGKFPARIQGLPDRDITAFDTVNEWASIAGDPSTIRESKIDIPVLGATPSRFRLLAPHQDWQFVANRPFFFMDQNRAFLVTSTGRSGRITRPSLGDWVNAELALAWRADFFPSSDPAEPDGDSVTPDASGETLRPFTVLALGGRGERVARRLAPVNLRPAFTPLTLLPIPWTTRQYTFSNFHHPYLCAFVKALVRQGIPGLLSLETQSLNVQSFAAYDPEPRVLSPRPADEVEFRSGGAYEVYNWELFFHIPLLIAGQLSRNQRFAEAQRWYHFIFDPTGASGDDIPQRYWRTRPFHERLSSDYEAESVKSIEETIAQGPSDALLNAIEVWRSNPFSPHAIARLRTTAYQKAIVMKYIDNLIAWGDQLFRRETIESINEATQLYVLAAEILGQRPEVIERDLKPAVETFDTLSPRLGALGNALERIELLVADTGRGSPTVDSPETPDLPSDLVLHFCVPENANLLAYWKTIADRLFKIRHCMNIEGQVRQLPLFEPPIDSALLVRAQAAGLSIGDALGDIAAPLPNYRFSVMVQKANEVSAEVRNLAAALLAVLEKRDGEALSLLRSGQEVRLLQAVRDIRVRQIDEAKRTIEGLQEGRNSAVTRKQYYESREFMNAKESASHALTSGTLDLTTISAAYRYLAGKLASIGALKLGSPTTSGLEVGPDYLARSLEADAGAIDASTSTLNTRSQLAGRLGEFTRRKDEWDHQANLATIEIKQIDRQLIAAEIRLAVAERELRNHDQQIDNAREVDQFMRDKYTNQELFQWHIGQISGVYFQSYQLAYDLAKRAERCFEFELGLAASGYISFGYWDSLRKGLLAGEKLQHDLRRLETAYLEQNRRELELTKHVSLALLNPEALVKLRETGRCDVVLPEEIFDLDYPGHYFRRIKSVSLTLPCVAGPYTAVACTLRLRKNSVRINTDDGINGYARNPDQGLPVDDSRFIEHNVPTKTIATSHAQNDSGIFEMSFRDERYLPFEGAGVISEWSVELFNDRSAPDFGEPLRQFDYNTISDAILHVKYTAQEGSEAFKDGAVAHLRDFFRQTPSLRQFSLRQEFPTQWRRFLNPADPAGGNVFDLDMSTELFAFRDHAKSLQIHSIRLLARCTDRGDYAVAFTLPSLGSSITLAPNQEFGDLHEDLLDVAALGIELSPAELPVKWQFRMTRPGGGNLQEDAVKGTMEVEDILLVLGYVWK